MLNKITFFTFILITFNNVCPILSQNIATHFKQNDIVNVRVSNVGPFHNPTEKYSYDYLPWPCKAPHHKSTAAFGSIINGERNRESLYAIHFLRSTTSQSLCDETFLDAKAVNQFIRGIRHEFQYEMVIDDLPVWGRVGFTQQNPTYKQYFLITHRHFHLRYNGDQVITVNISTRLQPGHYVELIKDKPTGPIHFTYSVSWSKTHIQFSQRFSAQLLANPTRYQIEAHWLWVLNSSLLVVLLTGLLSMILLRTLKNDVARYLQVDQIDQEEVAENRANRMDEADESGWKRVRFDVFRPPRFPFLFSSIVGVGAQILLIILCLLILAVIGYFYPGNHGRIYVAAIFLYSFTAYVAGYVGSAKLKEIAIENHDWMISCGITAFLFAGPFIFIFSVVNSVAATMQSSIALPFATILAIVLLWAFVTFPLTAIGAYRGGKLEIKNDMYPCPVKKIARSLPTDLPWYHNGILLIMTAGFLPFMAIYVEVHTIFMSVWGHQVYTLFGILLLTFIILLIVTSFIVILMCYFQLTAEDYHWWWPSVFRGSACGLFMYAYAIYYWCYNAKMSGGLQFIMYFGYTFVLSYAFCLMLAAVGHWSSRWFIIKIYNAIKGD